MLPLALLLAVQPPGEVPIPPRPEAGRYVADVADVLDAATIGTLDSIGAAAARRGHPVYVVTIASLSC